MINPLTHYVFEIINKCNKCWQWQLYITFFIDGFCHFWEIFISFWETFVSQNLVYSIFTCMYI